MTDDKKRRQLAAREDGSYYLGTRERMSPTGESIAIDTVIVTPAGNPLDPADEKEILCEVLTLLHNQHLTLRAIRDGVTCKSWFGRLICYLWTGHRNTVYRLHPSRYVCQACGAACRLPSQPPRSEEGAHASPSR